MDKLQQDVKKMMKEIEQLIARRLPVAAGKFAKRHFQDNFIKGGFVDGGLHAWPPAKRLSSGAPGADSQYRTLMSARNHLYSSINYTPGMAKVTIFTDVIYATVHNDGATLHPRITPKLRRFAWAKYYELGGGGQGPENGPKGAKKRAQGGRAGKAVPEEAEKWKRLALTKKESLTIVIPRRQFLGHSEELDAILTAYVEKEVLRIINQ